MPALARRVAGPDGIVDAYRIGVLASAIAPGPPLPEGNPDASPAQQLKYLWHAVAAYGADQPAAERPIPSQKENPPATDRRNVARTAEARFEFLALQYDGTYTWS